MKAPIVEQPEVITTPPVSPIEPESVSNSFHIPFSGSQLKLAGLIILIVGIIGTVAIAGYRQITNSHASGTVTLSVDKAVTLDIPNRKATFHIVLTSSGDTPPAVAAVKVRVDARYGSPRPTISLPPVDNGVDKGNGKGNGVVNGLGGSPLPLGGIVPVGLGLITFVPHMPLAFPLVSNNPSGIPPFSGQNPTISPLPSCPPNPSLKPVGAGSDAQPIPPCRYPRPTWYPVPSCPPNPSLGPVSEGKNDVQPIPPCLNPKPSGGPIPPTGGSPLPTCPPFQKGILERVSPTPQAPCVYGGNGGGVVPNGQGVGAPNAQEGKPIVVNAGGNVVISGMPGAGGTDTDINQRLDRNVLYFSVGDQYTKTVNSSVILADLTITVPLPEGFDPGKAEGDATIAQFKNIVLTISFGADSKVYGLSGDPKNPFASIPFIAQTATFTLQDILNGGITPTVTGGPVTVVPSRWPTPTLHPMPPVTITKGPKPVVDILTILDCLDLHKPISDPSSNYFSANCLKHTDRANADLNGDGWINQVDINLYYRQQLGTSPN